MPNHFLTIGLCVRDWSHEEEVDFSPLEGAELCKLVNPMPEVMNDIVSGGERYRCRNKKTGEIAQDVNGQHGPEWEKVPLTTEESERLKEDFGADCWYDWCSKHWGTKWGTYRTKVHEMEGDGQPILIEFVTAWSPPSPEMMRRITDYLCQKYYLKSIRWMGHDPGSDQTLEIEVADAIRVF